MKKIAQYSPSLWRLTEITIYSVLAYVAWKVLANDYNFSQEELIAVASVPLMAFVAKVKRDFEKEIEDEAKTLK